MNESFIPPQKVAIVVVENNNGEYLLVSRKNNILHFGFPGGGVEEGEEIVDAAVRELKEETGIEIESADLGFLFFSGFLNKDVTTFLCKKKFDLSGISVGPEGTMMKWTDQQNEIVSGPFHSYNGDLFEALKNKKA
jgi:8-oxo-dGTP pyrophosphatase MutT (NUDIX family)